jgi:hypothetical protein
MDLLETGFNEIVQRVLKRKKEIKEIIERKYKEEETRVTCQMDISKGLLEQINMVEKITAEILFFMNSSDHSSIINKRDPINSFINDSMLKLEQGRN